MKTSSISYRLLFLRIWCFILFSCAMPNVSSFAQVKLLKPLELIKQIPELKLTFNDTISRLPVRAAAKNGRSFAAAYTSAVLNNADPIYLREIDITDNMVGNSFQSVVKMRFHVSSSSGTSTVIQSIDKGISQSSNDPFTMTVNSIGSDGKITDASDYLQTKIKEFTIPALDPNSREIAEFLLQVQSPDVRTKSGNSAASSIGSKLKNALSGNFKMTLGDLPTTRVSSISAITVRKRDFLGAPSTKDSISDFTITVSGSDDVQWRNWLQDASLRTQKKSGDIQLLTPNLKDSIFTVTLTNVSIISFHTETSQGAGTVPRSTVGLRAENIRFAPN